MRILLIDVNGKNSSTGQLVFDLYSYLRACGNEAAVCYGRGDRINEEDIVKFGYDWETYLHAALTRLTGFTGCFSFFSTRRLLRFIEQFKPDVVHIHELHAYFVNIQPLFDYLNKKRIKVIHTLHSEFSYTGKCGHSVECEKWKTECDHCPRLHDYVRSEFFDHTKYMFNQKRRALTQMNELILTAPSAWLYNRIGESFLKDYPRFIVHNGVDTDTFKPVDTDQLRKELAVDLEEKVFLALAPNLMDKAKGGEYIKRMASDMSCEKVRFIMVGVNGETMRTEGNIIICGSINDKEKLAQYYSLADAFIICSMRENYPTTCLEAQACGTPVYGFDTGGTRETLLMQDTDPLVEYGDLESLEALLRSVNKKTQESVESLRRLAVDNLSRTKTLGDYCKLYEG